MPVASGKVAAIMALAGMVLCAGLDPRLRPPTGQVPRLAVPIFHVPLIRHGLGLVAALGLAACGAGLPADPDPFGAMVPVAVEGYVGVAMEPALSPNGDLLLFNDSNASGVDTNLHWATRVDEFTFSYQGPVAGANSTVLDGVPSLDQAGTLYFISLRAYTETSRFTVHRGAFAAGTVSGIEVVPGLEASAPGWVIFDAFISGDGQQLWFAEGDYRSGLLGAAYLHLALKNGSGGFTRAADGDLLLRTVNQLGAAQYAPAVSADGLELFFTRLTGTGTTAAVYHARRPNTASPWGAPDVIPSLVGGVIEAPAPSADGRALYVHHQVGSTFRLARVARR
jgi:hypothetical protein